MTLPYERYYALTNALHFLQDLLDRSKTKKIPLEIRMRARSVLKHFPHEIEIEKIAKMSKSVVEMPYEGEE